jgi:hypothetical protein
LRYIIDFFINIMPREAPVSKSPYRMSTPKLKELQMKLEELLKKGYICPSVSLGCLSFICEEKGWNIETLH